MKIARPAAALAAVLFSSHFSSVDAQQADSPAIPFLGFVVDDQGMTPTDPNGILYRAGTDPQAPLTRSNGDLITFDDFNNATGQISIAARPGGGTSVTVEVAGLFPNELYSAWGNWFQSDGTRVGFGPITEMGDGSDNFTMSDANGSISLDLVQLEGPLTVQGSAPDYAPRSPMIDSGGNAVPFSEYVVAVAYHFNNPPSPPFTNPGPIETWAVQAVGVFPAIPEPSSIVMSFLAIACSILFVWRRRT